MTAPQKDNRTLLLKVMHVIRLMVKETLRDSWYHCSKLIIINLSCNMELKLVLRPWQHALYRLVSGHVHKYQLDFCPIVDQMYECYKIIYDISKYITILDTVKPCPEEWCLTDRKLHFIWTKYRKNIITWVRSKKRMKK